ncbi:hypothetical protein PCASD_06659 [Puccinia coronata f. sp. avenae]|uniref:Long chronological lifespan protein 2 n=1 Tax=Puccinia coronata f. sp. avenae TaxID=200324 RepID=A0A2N5UGX9_9BASI|nr:hypothetical protein PCASD_06659 [Puccinia coronata f. sp. avenae]
MAAFRPPPSRLVWLLLVGILVLLLMTNRAQCQFGNIFEQFFQQDDGDHAHHQGHHKAGKGSADEFRVIRDQAQCGQYLCPSPSDCPCPFVEDIKCPVSIRPPPSSSSSSSSSSSPKVSNSFVCTRAPGCSVVQKALMFGS